MDIDIPEIGDVAGLTPMRRADRPGIGACRY
jgi:hypothetical protein